jgi:hypothetical protein
MSEELLELNPSLDGARNSSISGYPNLESQNNDESDLPASSAQEWIDSEVFIFPGGSGPSLATAIAILLWVQCQGWSTPLYRPRRFPLESQECQ